MKHRAYRFRFYPTDEQAKLLAQTLAVCDLSITTFCVGVLMSITKASKK